MFEQYADRLVADIPRLRGADPSAVMWQPSMTGFTAVGLVPTLDP